MQGFLHIAVYGIKKHIIRLKHIFIYCSVHYNVNFEFILLPKIIKIYLWNFFEQLRNVKNCTRVLLLLKGS